MKQLLFNCKYFGKGLALTLLVFSFSLELKAQNQIKNVAINRYHTAQQTLNSNNLNRTAATTCPTSVSLAAQDSTNYAHSTSTTIANNSTLACGNQSIILYANGGSATNENTPCVETLYTTYYTNIRNNITETFYEGGQFVGCVGPTGSGCSFPIGGTPNTGINGVTSWGVLLGYLDPSQQHDFSFCRGANPITTTSVSLVDCWTGAVLLGPQQLSTATTAPCFTMTLPANTNIGTYTFSIAPATASVALTDYGFAYAQVSPYLLPAGTYTVSYTFTPPPSSGCAPVTTTYKFTVGPNPTINVTSPTACSGNTATLTASGTSTSYSWTPSAGLSSTTGASVTYNGSSSSTYTVTGFKGACFAKATSTVTINPTPTLSVNSPSICAGGTATLTVNGAATYSWTPSTGLSATTGSVVTASPSANTVYTVTGTSISCTASATSTVSISPSATITTTSATVCPGGTGTLIANGANTYIWTPATGLNTTTGATVQANPSSTTVYTVSGSVGTCSAVAGTATLTVSSIGSLIVSNDTAICPGTSATLTATGATTYSWSPTTGISPTTGSVVIANPSVSTSYTITGTTGGCTSHGVINVTISPTPTITVNSASICLGDSAKLKATGATTYSWASATGLNTTVGDSVKASPSATTIYTVTGTALGCSSKSTSTVTIISNPTITITANPNPVCTGGSSTLTATGATTYTWSANPTLSTATGSVTVATPTLNPTSYTVSGSVGTCSAIPTVITVSITPNATLTVSNDTTICPGSTITLTASGATSYGWANASGTVISLSASVAVTPTVTQTYYVAGNPSSCRVLDSVKVIVNATPTVTASSNPTAICAGQQTATLTANGATTYTWSPATNLSAATGSVVTTNNTTNASITYTVTGTDANGCTNKGTVSLTVNQPSPISVASTSICAGSTATLTANGATTYTWSTGAIGTTITPSPTITTSYTVVGVDANTCSSYTIATVTVNNLPAVTATSAATCVNSSIPLTASGATTYTWNPTADLSSPNGSPVNATPIIAGTVTYTVSGTDGNGCVNTATATVLANPKPTVSASVDKPIICKGDVINLTATGATNYTWLPAASLTGANTANPTGTPSLSTNYTVTGTNSFGCKNTSVVSVTTSTVHAAISANPTEGEAPLTVVFTNNSTGGTVYTWNYGNGSATQVTTGAGVTTQTIYQNQGTYTVTLLAANAAGCKDSITTTIIVSEGFSISIPNIFTPNGDGINDNFFVKSNGVTNMNIMILDRWGLKMWESSSVTGTWDGRNGSKEATDGTYFYIIKVVDNKGISTDYKGPLTLMR